MKTIIATLIILDFLFPKVSSGFSEATKDARNMLSQYFKNINIEAGKVILMTKDSGFRFIAIPQEHEKAIRSSTEGGRMGHLKKRV